MLTPLVFTVKFAIVMFRTGKESVNAQLLNLS